MPKMTDPRILVRAFEKLGWKVVQNAHVRTWAAADREVVYPWVALNPNEGYDLGITQDPKTKQLTVAGDTSMLDRGAWAVLGDNFDKLKQQYSVQSVLDWADLNNGSATQEVLPNGVISMEVEVEVFS